MKGKTVCSDCGEQLNKNEIALSQKMLGRGIVEFFCIACLADSLDCEQTDLHIKILEFKEQGCALFI